MSRVEEALRAQREAWREISDRASHISMNELCPEAPKRILLFGVGSSHFAARLAGFALLRDRVRRRIPVVACSSMSIGVDVTPGKGDWAFGLSHRGKTRATLQALETCERLGAYTLLVASKGVTEGPGSSYVLQTCDTEVVEPHTISVTGAICAVTSLLLGPKAIEEWDALRSIGDPSLDLMRERAAQGPSAILGEWEGEWLAREGALKLMEMARLPVRAYGSEEFFHGPRLSFGASDVIWHVGMGGDARADELRAALRLNVTGASPLAFVPTLVELQWLALATALNRGTDPDASS